LQKKYLMDTAAELPVSPTRTAMTVGAVTAALMLVVLTFGLQILGWIVFAGGIYYGMKRFRKEAGGRIGYFGALNTGIQTAFFASLICAFFIYLSATLEPSLIDQMLDAAEQRLQTSGVSTVLIENATQQLRAALSPVVLAAVTVLMYSAIGCIVGAVCAIFMQNEQPRVRGNF
jgi:hypothetical protein